MFGGMWLCDSVFVYVKLIVVWCDYMVMFVCDLVWFVMFDVFVLYDFEIVFFMNEVEMDGDGVVYFWFVYLDGGVFYIVYCFV